MADQWFVIVDETGQERSSGTVIAAKLPDGWEAIPLSKAPDAAVEKWDKNAQAYVPRQPRSENRCPTCGQVRL